MVRLSLASDHRVCGAALSLHKLDSLSGCAEARVCRDRVYLEDHARAYLLSWIPDNYFYRILNDAIPNIPTRLNYFPVMVALTAFTSLAAAALVQCAVNLIMLPFKKRRPPSPPDAPNAPVDSKPQPELVA